MFFKKNLIKLQIFLFLISIFSIPSLVFAYPSKVIFGGENIGIEINSNGVLVVGFYEVDGKNPGVDANLQLGDRIIKIDDTVIDGITDLSNVIDQDVDEINITYVRNNKTYNTKLKLYKDSNNVYKTGLYVKDTIIGIGTLTFIDPEIMKFGALGHEITEKTTGQKFEINNGNIFRSEITGVNKATRNEPGEKKANYYTQEELGIIDKNEITGIYGTYKNNIKKENIIDVAENNEIELGTASIKTVIEGNKVETFGINIIQINYDSATKNILFEVTDKTLIEKTGGIVQGMSGSPIIQNNKIIGAVTHVLSDDSTKGYGIFITTMLKEIEN